MEICRKISQKKSVKDFHLAFVALRYRILFPCLYGTVDPIKVEALAVKWGALHCTDERYTTDSDLNVNVYFFVHFSRFYNVRRYIQN